MSMSEENPVVQHLPEQHMFKIELEGTPAVLEYAMGKEGTLMIMHTEVPAAHNGKGYADRLAKETMAYVGKNDLKAMPYCSYMATFLRRHKEEYKDLVSPEFNLG